MQTVNVTMTIPLSKLNALTELLTDTDSDVGTTKDSLAALTTKGKRGTSKRAKKSEEPEETVSEDEEVDFGDDAIDEDELDEDEAEEDEESQDDDALDFATVRKAVNAYGEKNPKDMKAIFASFNIKGTKELQALPKKWEAVYRKVMAKTKPAKRTRK